MRLAKLSLSVGREKEMKDPCMHLPWLAIITPLHPNHVLGQTVLLTVVEDREKEVRRKL